MHTICFRECGTCYDLNDNVVAWIHSMILSLAANMRLNSKKEGVISETLTLIRNAGSGHRPNLTESGLVVMFSQPSTLLAASGSSHQGPQMLARRSPGHYSHQELRTIVGLHSDVMALSHNMSEAGTLWSRGAHSRPPLYSAGLLHYWIATEFRNMDFIAWEHDVIPMLMFLQVSPASECYPNTFEWILMAMVDWKTRKCDEEIILCS